MDDLFDAVFHGKPIRRYGHGSQQAPQLWLPEIEMREDGDRLRVCIDLPGIKKDDVQIEVHDGALVVQGERSEESNESNEQGFRRSERRYGRFYREIALPESVDAEKADARMQDGVLEITFPVNRELKKPRRLEIKD